MTHLHPCPRGHRELDTVVTEKKGTHFEEDMKMGAGHGGDLEGIGWEKGVGMIKLYHIPIINPMKFSKTK